jgi:DNA-binding transcriptional ArsR family regulator
LLAKRLPPAPAARETVARARRAVSRVPDPEADCCARIGEAVGVDRRTARDWLTLLRATGLVERTADGYRRTDDAADDLRARVLDGVYGARAALAALDGGRADAATVADAVRQPTWERRRTADPEGAWGAHDERQRDWGGEVGAAERVDGAYRRAAEEPDP